MQSSILRENVKSYSFCKCRIKCKNYYCDSSGFVFPALNLLWICNPAEVTTSTKPALKAKAF